MIAIRRASPGDAQRLVPLIHAHAAFEQGAARCPPADLAQALSGPSPILLGWVAEQAGQLVAYATATRDFATWDCCPYLHLDCLFVIEEARSSGIGRKLLAEIVAYARTLSLPRIEWQTPAWNENACRFYRRFGAVSNDKRRFVLAIGDLPSP